MVPNYCVLFSHYRQWLPPDKVEPLGVSTEGDNLKLSQAGSSKRSVKEAYTRAKQWLRKRARHRSTTVREEGEKEGERETSCDSNLVESPADELIDCDS